uniref:G-patch domain-containing protein n=1 Tax=Labrus bergylta TaxID=56723 RepID=A0A3Q3EP69_9LABR
MAALGFTRASGQDIFSIESAEPTNSKTGSAFSGEQVRQFYEHLIKEDTDQDASRASRSNVNGREHQRKRGSRRRERRRDRAAEMPQRQTESVLQQGNDGESEGNQSRETNNSERSMELLGLRLLRCAHEGDISSLRDLRRKYIICIDLILTVFPLGYLLWTAVMCASWSGQRAAVKLLLQHGAAWVGVVDTQGRDAKDLALEGTAMTNPVSNTKFCVVCSDDVLIHIDFPPHLRRPSPTPYYCLPPSSNSYKMMVQCGWKPGTGLGPEGEGPKQPVPTVLKRDQTGLGYGEAKRAKITHFQARDPDAVKQSSKQKQEKRGKGQRKEHSRRKEQNDKNWERDFLHSQKVIDL